MYIKKDDSLTFYVKNIVITLLLVVHPFTISAQGNCVDQHGISAFCQEEKLTDVTEKLQKNEDVSVATLYYSGSILQNKVLINGFGTPLEMTNVTNAEPVDALASDISTPISPVDEADDLYKKISGKFRNFDSGGRKKIQKCLRYGSYSAKVDGLWGDQTFDAIIDFQNAIKIAQKDDEQSVFSKLKNVFSNKNTCYDLINDIFQL